MLWPISNSSFYISLAHKGNSVITKEWKIDREMRPRPNGKKALSKSTIQVEHNVPTATI